MDSSRPQLEWFYLWKTVFPKEFSRPGDGSSRLFGSLSSWHVDGETSMTWNEVEGSWNFAIRANIQLSLALGKVELFANRDLEFVLHSTGDKWVDTWEVGK